MRWTYVLSVLSVLLLACNKKEEAWKEAMGHPFPEARVAAFQRLIEQVAPGDLEYLVLASKDFEPGVRMLAAKGLGKSRQGYALDVLSNLLMDADERVQVAAASAMGQSSSEKARQYLLVRFPKSRQPARQAIVQALKASGMAEPMKQAVRFEAEELWTQSKKTLALPSSLAEQVSALVRLGESGRDEAVDLLLPFLKEQVPALTVAAAEGLANLGAHAALPKLQALALSGNADIRKAGILAVAGLRSATSLPWLIQLTEAEEETALLALEGLEGFPSSPETDKVMCALAVSPGNPQLRFRAALALANRRPCLAQPLLEQLSSPNLAKEALLVLMRWPDAWGHEADKVWALLKADNPGLSALAAQALSQAYAQGNIQEKRPEETAWVLGKVASLAKREEPWIKSPLEDGFGVRISQQSAENAERRQRQELLVKKVEARNAALLKEMGKQAARPLALPELAGDLSQAELEQWAAFLGLASFLQPASVEGELKRWVDAPEVSLRMVALAALAGMGPALWDLAEQGIFDTSEEVRMAVAKAFVKAGFEGEKRLLAALEKRTEDSSALLSMLSCKQLDEKSAQTVRAFLDKSTREASWAVRCLGQAKYTAAQEELLSLLNAPRRVSKKAVVEALLEMEAKGAAKEIENQLLHESPEIRQAAARALCYLGAGDSKEVQEALQEDYFKRVRQDGMCNI